VSFCAIFQSRPPAFFINCCQSTRCTTATLPSPAHYIKRAAHPHPVPLLKMPHNWQTQRAGQSSARDIFLWNKNTLVANPRRPSIEQAALSGNALFHMVPRNVPCSAVFAFLSTATKKPPVSERWGSTRIQLPKSWAYVLTAPGNIVACNGPFGCRRSSGTSSHFSWNTSWKARATVRQCQSNPRIQPFQSRRAD
jgi:hypothetical protein